MNRFQVYLAERQIWREVKRLGLTWETSEHAPNTYENLAALCPGRHMVVYSGGSDKTIWSSPEVNYAFRAWHDYIHVQFKLPFTLEGETAAARIQSRSLSGLAKRLIEIEVIDQAKHFLATGEFVADQRAFTIKKLRGAK